MPLLSIILLLLHSAMTNLRLFSLALVATAPPHSATLAAATPLFSLLSLSFLSGKMRWAILLPLHFNTIPMQTFPFINSALLLFLCECACVQGCVHVCARISVFHPATLLCGTKLPAGYCSDVSQGFKQIKVSLQPRWYQQSRPLKKEQNTQKESPT